MTSDPTETQEEPQPDDEKYGGPVKTEVFNQEFNGQRWVGTRVVHTGPDRHDEVPDGKQCRCGWMKIGIIE